MERQKDIFEVPSSKPLSHLLSTVWNDDHEETDEGPETGVPQQSYKINYKRSLLRKMGSYRRSISSNISFAHASPCSSTKYSPIHITRWSLKVPLMTWWRRSGVRISWMSALGKWNVKGYIFFSEWDGVKKELEEKIYNHIVIDTKLIPELLGGERIH